jgi:antitoxin component of MazEF toxin-antitoxin module
MSVTLHELGNRVGLRLPKPLLEQLGLKAGSEVDVKVEGNCLVIEPAHRRRYTMAELLEGFHARQQARGGRLGQAGRW